MRDTPSFGTEHKVQITDIYHQIATRFPYYRDPSATTATLRTSMKNCVRHGLTMQTAFVRLHRVDARDGWYPLPYPYY
jgi:hypothetical protein